MGSFTDYLENAFLNHMFGTAYTAPTTVYLALCTADPTDAATGASMNELANANAYARVAIAFDAAASRRVTQSADVTFTEFTGGSTTASHWALVDSATHGAGNVLAFGAFDVAKNLVAGSTPTVADSEIYVEFSAGAVSTALAHLFLDKAFRNQTFAQPSTYVGLVTSASSDSAVGTEVSGNNYARVLVNKTGGGSPAMGTVASGAVTNANAITFPTPSGSWGTVVGVAVFSAATTGTFFMYDNGVTDQLVSTSDTVTIPASDFDVSIT